MYYEVSLSYFWNAVANLRSIKGMHCVALRTVNHRHYLRQNEYAISYTSASARSTNRDIEVNLAGTCWRIRIFEIVPMWNWYPLIVKYFRQLANLAKLILDLKKNLEVDLFWKFHRMANSTICPTESVFLPLPKMSVSYEKYRFLKVLVIGISVMDV